jgi:hypothetical protein
MSPLGARQVYNRFRKIYEQDSKHAINLAHAHSFRPERLLFRVDFTITDPKIDRGFIPDPKHAPLATPAFIAGNPSPPRGVDAELIHCGGKIATRDDSAYISCTKDLLWCFWYSGKSILKKNEIQEARIYIIADGDQYKDIQTDMYAREYWDNLGGTSVDADTIRRARTFSVPASEVLVYKEVGRERILGIVRIDREVLRTAGLEELLFSHGPVRLFYRFVLAAIAEKSLHEQVAPLAEWCEENMEYLKCLGKPRICFILGLFDALMFGLSDALMNLVDDLERDLLDEYLRDNFYYPWRDHLETHREDHSETLGDNTLKAVCQIVPIPVFSRWTIEYWLRHYPSKLILE